MSAIPVVNRKDRQVGIIAALITLSLLILYLILTTFQMADPPPRDFVMKTETIIEQIDLENLKLEAGGMGGGTPSDDVVAPPTPQTQQVLTKPKNDATKVITGQSTHTTKPNPNNTATTTQHSTNPFGTGGRNGKKGGGSDGPFANDNGPSGTGPGGNGGGDGRTRLNDPNVSDIETNVNITIYLKLTINADGNVVSAISTFKTTTTDQRIINQVISAVKNQVKYNKDSGAGMSSVSLTVRVNAT